MPNADPISDGEADRLFAPFTQARGLALAVSGGPDSTALMLLVAEWRSRLGSSAPPGIVLTVDHGLRPEAAAEADAVARRARSLGLACQTLSWTGEKPSTGIQAAARTARYRLLAEAAHRHGCDRLLVAHTEDDQAETFLLALARGSGIYGLAAMPAERPLELFSFGSKRSQPNGTAPAPRSAAVLCPSDASIRWEGPAAPVILTRPFLQISKARLIATLEARREPWIDDPSNADPRFHRVAVRRVLHDLAGSGFRLDAAGLARTAARMARAAAAIDAVVDRLFDRALVRHPGGYARLDRAAWAGEPEEVRLRALSRILLAIGGAVYAPRLVRLEALDRNLAAGPDASPRTLAGSRVVPEGDKVFVFREFGRSGPPVLDLRPGESGTWDGRFDVTLSADAPGSIRVAPLGMAGARRLRPEIRGAERTALSMAPAAFVDATLCAVPALGIQAPGFHANHLAMVARPRAAAFECSIEESADGGWTPAP